MEPFHIQNKFLIFLSAFSCLYLKCLEKLVTNRAALLLFEIWSWMPILLIPIYIISDWKFIVFHNPTPQVTQGVIRRDMAFLSFTLKSAFYLTKKMEMDRLFQLWDSSFKEDFYPVQRKLTLEKLYRRMNPVVKLSFFLMALPGVTYGIPPFFSKTKKLSHPTGFPFREQSPDYEFMITYDLIRVITGCCLSAASDCILMVLFSLEMAQIEHLYNSLKDMVGTFAVDNDGNFLIRQALENKDLELSRKISEDGTLNKKIFKMFKIQKFQFAEKQFYVRFHPVIYKNAINRFEKDLRIWILHHQEAITYFEALQKLFKPLASMQMVYVVLYTCFTAFQLVAFKTTITELLTIPVVATSNLISLFVWSRICDNFDPKGHGLFGGAFGRHWFLYPRKIRQAFYFISMRCKRPLAIKGLSLFPMNSVTFFEIIKLAYQLFAFLRHIYSKKSEMEQ